jgi:hypothetical protein
MSMIAEKWRPVFGNDHAQTKAKGEPMTQLKIQAR